MSEEDLMTKIGKLAGEICCLSEDEISDTHPKVIDLQRLLVEYQNSFGKSAVSQIMRSEFTFDDVRKRIQLFEEAVSMDADRKDLEYVKSAFSDLQEFCSSLVNDHPNVESLKRIARKLDAG